MTAPKRGAQAAMAFVDEYRNVHRNGAANGKLG